MVEFLRLGSQIPGGYYGCCAVDVIQDFSSPPEAPCSIQVTDGDSGCPSLVNGEFAFLGPTNLDVFKQRLRLGTFWTSELQNHAFLAVLTDGQVNSPYNSTGRKWLAVLKDHGFEFMRAIRNSVYYSKRPPVYLFGLFRNIGDGVIENPSEPPKAWTDLPECKLSQQEIWDRDRLTFMTEAELRKANVPVFLAGQRGTLPRVKPEGEVQNVEDGLNGEASDEDLYIGEEDTF